MTLYNAKFDIISLVAIERNISSKTSMNKLTCVKRAREYRVISLICNGQGEYIE